MLRPLKASKGGSNAGNSAGRHVLRGGAEGIWAVLLGHKAISLLPAVSSGGEPEAAGCAPTAHGRTCENGTELPGEDQTVLWERLIDCESDQCREVS